MEKTLCMLHLYDVIIKITIQQKKITSHAYTVSAPSLAAIIANSPVPVPMSRTFTGCLLSFLCSMALPSAL